MILTPAVRAWSLFVIATLLALLILEGNQRQVHADVISDLDGLGDRIICKVFGNLNDVGDPLPPLTTDGDCSQTPPPPPTPQCSDGIDNDNDGLIDTADPGCSGSSDNDETNAAAPSQCGDGVDNDSDGFIDSNDPNCHTDGDPSNASSYDSSGGESGTLPACWNGQDDDGDGFGDFPADSGCSSATDSDESNPAPPESAENTLALCSDNADNDGDTRIDLADSDCSIFKPLIVVIKSVINDNGGTGIVSNFSLNVATTGPGMAETIGVSSGATTTLPFAGLWKVGEAQNSNYTASFGGDCNAGGEVTIGIGQMKTCTITNNDVAPQAPACSDGIDNDSDGFIDSADPGCSGASDTDEVNSNGSTGSDDNQGDGESSDNNGSTDTGSNNSNNSGSTGSGGGGGGGNGPSVGTYGVIDGTAGGIVLGASTSTVVVAATELSSTESCDTFITAYIRAGKANDPEQVKRLQMTLKDIEGADLQINGIYDEATLSAVHDFQTKYSADILAPWGIEKSTGFVYITTRRKLNEIYCKKTKQFPFTTQELQEIVRVRELAQPAADQRASSAPQVSTAPQPPASPEVELVQDQVGAVGRSVASGTPVGRSLTPRRLFDYLRGFIPSR